MDELSKKKLTETLLKYFFITLAVSFIISFIVFIINKNKCNSYMSVQLCVKGELLMQQPSNGFSTSTDIQTYFNALKKLNVNHIIFDKITLPELSKNGDITVKNGYEIIDAFKSQSIINPYIFQHLKRKNITPQHSYIFIDSQDLFALLYPCLKEKLFPHEVKIYEDGKFVYDGDISNNYIIEVNALKDEYESITLFYPDNFIKESTNNGFKIGLIDPDTSDVFKYYDYSPVAIFDNAKIEDIFSFSDLAIKNFTIAVSGNIYYKLSFDKKIKYLGVSPSMLKKNILLEKQFSTGSYNLLIYSSTQHNIIKTMNELKIILDFFKSKKINVNRNITIYKLIENLKIILVLNIIILVLFYVILYLKADSLLFFGFFGILLSCLVYTLRIDFFLPKRIIFQIAAFQVLSVQYFVLMLQEKEFKPLFKAALFMIFLYYFSVLSVGGYMYGLMDINIIGKRIIVLFQLFSFIFGIYTFRKKFENIITYNSIQIILLISVIIVIFKNDLGLPLVFENFYNKIIRSILLFYD